MQLDVKDLELVERVVDEGTLTKAAVALGVTQSALSHRLGELEKRLGIGVFKRVGRTLQLSPASARLLETARQVLPVLRQAEEDLARIAAGKQGTVRISTECYTCYHWLPDVVARFREAYPDVDVRIVAEATRHPIPALLESRIDIGIVSGPVDDVRLHERPLFDDELVAVVPSDHAWSEKAFVRPPDFAGEHLILYAADDSSVVRDFLQPAGIRPGRITEMQLTEGILELVRAGLGVTVLARWAVAPELDSGSLRAVRLGPAGLRRTWSAVTLGNEPSPAEREMIELLRTGLPADEAAVGRGAA